MGAVEVLEGEVKNLFGGLALDSRKGVEEAVAAVKKELGEAAEKLAGVKAQAKTDVQAELRNLRAAVSTAVKDAEPEVKTAVDAALAGSFEKILALLA